MRVGAILGFLFVLIAVPARAARAADDSDAVPAQDLRAGGDARMRYLLIGPASDAKAPGAGYALLLVLPGGDGSADFAPFVKRIYRNAVPRDFVLAQLVAVESKDPKQIVWPTQKSPHPKQTFTTERFIDAAIEDVKGRVKIDERRIYALAWSSSGPAVYAATLRNGSPLRGAFVAMSVFVPANLPPLAGAKGKRFYLLQSPQDQVTRYVFATRAESQLRAAGATVKLQDYGGGHGWRGDVYGMLREGMQWMDSGEEGSD
jgi:predicted esterase